MLQKPINSPGRALRHLFAESTVLMPGVFNAISAVSAAKCGASALYVSGAGITNGSLGVPDIALATLTEFATEAAKITAVVNLPVLSDADTGFGETWNVFRTVVEMERAGLAGIHIEDQVMPKRCGHLEGKSLIPAGEMAGKISSAVSAKRDSAFLIVARTDARGVEGLPAAIDRAKRYTDAGADAIFPEGLESDREFEEFRHAVELPLLANMTEFGKTPIIPLSRFQQLGYQMVIFPMTAFRAMIQTFELVYTELIDSGTQSGLMETLKTRKQLYDLIDYDEYIAMDSTLQLKRLDK